MDEDPEKHKLRSARNNFFNTLLKRPYSKPPSVRYEDTTTADPISMPSASRRFMLLRRRTDDSHEGEDDGKKTSLIIRFYDPEVKAKDANGRTLDDMLGWDDAKLERCHNYIQMLFPLPEGSPFNFEAPVINRTVLEAFLARDNLRARLRESFERILRFYGFEVLEVTDEEEEGGQGGKEEKASASDARPEGHNHVEGHSEVSGDARVLPEEQITPIEEEGTRPEQATQQITVPATAKAAGNQSATSKEPVIEQQTTEVSSEPKFTSILEVGEMVRSTDEVDPEEEQKIAFERYKSLFPTNLIIVRAPNWRKAFKNWAIRFDHNHLRITRVLRSLRVLGLQEESEAFYNALKHVFQDPRIRINERSMIFWRRAVRLPLSMAPDGDPVHWMKRWEAEKEEKDAAKGTESIYT